MPSIECEEAKLTAKRTNTYPPTKHPILKNMVYNFKLQRGAIAEIAKELNPKKHILDENSLLDIGTIIRGEVIECTSLSPITPQKGPFSGRHRAQYSIAKKYCFCRVFIPFAQFKERQ